MVNSFPESFYRRVLDVLLSNIENYETVENPEALLTETLELLAHFLQLHKGRILLWDSNTAQLVVRYSYGLSEVDRKKAKYEVCEGLTGNIMDTGKPVLVNNLFDEPDFAGKITKIQNEFSPLSYIAVPICFQNMILGVLAVECRHQQDGDLEANALVLQLLAETFAKIIHSYSLCDLVD